jgi:perosamine synthetase
MNVPVYRPFLGKEERDNVLSALGDESISGFHGRFISEFERGFAQYSDCSEGVAVNSGTAALHLAIASLGIGVGDEVLVSSFTNMATFFSVIYQNAKPIPVDIEPDTWNINPSLIEEKITEKTKAILVVHIYGHPVDMDPVLKIARKHSLYVIEDCAEAHGALYKGKKVGSFGDVGCFSFYGNKIITTGEGGMLTTNNVEVADKARSLRSLAFGSENKFMHEAVGFNYRMTNLQAAVGCAQLAKIDRIINRKREIARFYDDSLRDVVGLQLPVEKAYAKNVYWMYHLLVDKDAFGFSRNEVMTKLAGFGVETREAFVPYNKQKLFIQKGWVQEEDCPIANYVSDRGFYLPSSPLLSPQERNYVVEHLKRIRNCSVA